MAAAPLLASARSAWAANATPPTIEEFANKPLVRGAALSPDGKHVALIKQADEGKTQKTFVDLMDADDPDLKRRRVPLGDLDVLGLSWGADDRLLVPVFYGVRGELQLARTVAMGLDGGSQVVLFGREPEILGANFDLTEIVDLLPDDSDHVLMRAADPQVDVWALYRVNIRTGSAVQIERGNLNTTWWWTQGGVTVLRQDINGSDTVATYYVRPSGQADWKLLRRTRISDVRRPDFELLSPTDDPDIWLVSTTAEMESARAVHRFNLATATLGDVMLQRQDRDVGDCLLDGRRQLVAAAFEDDRLSYEFADASLAAHYRGINSFFSNASNVELLGITRDHNRLLALVTSPTDPGGYYFYDRAAHNLKGLDATYPWLASPRLAPVEMLDVKARDGLAFRAYLTVPLATGPRPLVVMPHGGPELRDTYGFDVFAQAFAAQGWMVLQPNFRGSGGYGRAFAEAGHRHWGDLMQQDVEDAANLVVASGRVDPKRIAIWGASYGGYSALMGVIRRPDFYRGAVALAGVCDVAAMLAHDRRDDPGGVVYAYMVERVGDPKADAELIAAESPIKHVAAIKVPILLMHGTKDTTVDPGQSHQMAEALRQAGKVYTYVELKDADHYLDDWDTTTRKTVLQTSVDFLGKAFA